MTASDLASDLEFMLDALGRQLSRLIIIFFGSYLVMVVGVRSSLLGGIRFGQATGRKVFGWEGSLFMLTIEVLL